MFGFITKLSNFIFGFITKLNHFIFGFITKFFDFIFGFMQKDVSLWRNKIHNILCFKEMQ